MYCRLHSVSWIMRRLKHHHTIFPLVADRQVCKYLLTHTHKDTHAHARAFTAAACHWWGIHSVAHAAGFLGRELQPFTSAIIWHQWSDFTQNFLIEPLCYHCHYMLMTNPIHNFLFSLTNTMNMETFVFWVNFLVNESTMSTDNRKTIEQTCINFEVVKVCQYVICSMNLIRADPVACTDLLHIITVQNKQSTLIQSLRITWSCFGKIEIQW